MNPLVSISCITYNHAPFIRKCLDSFINQKTDFDFEVLIHDDASTDGTQDIIKEYQVKYPHIVKPILRNKNLYSQGVRGMNRFNFERSKGRYIALCEGDDYWCDSYKLQKQVNILESNLEYVICSSGFISMYEDELEETNLIYKDTNEGFHYNLDDLSKYWLTKTMTVVFRKEYLNDYMNNYNLYKYLRDTHLIYYILRGRKGYYMSSIMGVYNKHEGGIASLVSLKDKALISYEIYQELYQITKEEVFHFQLFMSILSRIRHGSYSSLFELFSLVLKVIRNPHFLIKRMNLRKNKSKFTTT